MTATHHCGNDQFASCGTWACDATTSTTERALVTCKSCLRSLAKRDREFQWKAREGLSHANYIGWVARHAAGMTGIQARQRVLRHDAKRAIKREEGRK